LGAGAGLGLLGADGAGAGAALGGDEAAGSGAAGGADGGGDAAGAGAGLEGGTGTEFTIGAGSTFTVVPVAGAETGTAGSERAEAADAE
jgi:endoglucanase